MQILRILTYIIITFDLMFLIVGLINLFNIGCNQKFTTYHVVSNTTFSLVLIMDMLSLNYVFFYYLSDYIEAIQDVKEPEPISEPIGCPIIKDFVWTFWMFWNTNVIMLIFGFYLAAKFNEVSNKIEKLQQRLNRSSHSLSI